MLGFWTENIQYSSIVPFILSNLSEEVKQSWNGSFLGSGPRNNFSLNDSENSVRCVWCECTFQKELNKEAET